LRILFIHCDYFSFTVTKPTKFAERVETLCKSCGIKDAFVAFVTIERHDDDKTVDRAVEEFKIKAHRLGVENVIIYPFAHLSNEIGEPNQARKLIDLLLEKLKKENFNVEKAPFGWEKAFSLTSKGHPLAESLVCI
jgi:threonyl-tRNA synthetase